MELSWLSRLRLTLAVATGIILVCIVARPLAAPMDPYSPVTLFQHRIALETVLTIAGLAFAAGFIAYFASWPYGREMAVVAAPAGLAAIAFRSGSIADLMRMYPAAADRIAAYSAFRYEGFIWLAIIVAGIAGGLVARLVRIPTSRPNAVDPTDTLISPSPKVLLNAILALCLATGIAYIALAVFVKGVSTPAASGKVSGEPLAPQIACGTIIAFGVAAFAIKLVFNFGWPISLAATATLNFVLMLLASNSRLLTEMAEKWPAATLAQGTFGILPIQLVSFGTLGSVLGYWLAVRYNVWRKWVEVM
jgi:hypothetical protein